MSSKLTAEEARKLSKQNNPGFILENILELVKTAASKGEFKTRVYNYGFGESTLYSNPPTEKQREIIRQLERLGYKASIRVVERQLVDIFLEVEWSESE